jgi:anti-sigma regulatory factor (Ser/Thr protein kinase)
MLEIIGMSRIAKLFCMENGIDKKKTNALSLCIEELGTNILEHGFADGKPHSIDLRILAKDGEIILRIRDDCRPFNLVERYEMSQADEEDPAKNLGIRMVMRMSTDVQYLSIMGTNNLIIRI